MPERHVPIVGLNETVVVDLTEAEIHAISEVTTRPEYEYTKTPLLFEFAIDVLVALDYKVREHVLNGDECWCFPTVETVEAAPDA